MSIGNKLGKVTKERQAHQLIGREKICLARPAFFPAARARGIQVGCCILDASGFYILHYMLSNGISKNLFIFGGRVGRALHGAKQVAAHVPVSFGEVTGEPVEQQELDAK